MSSPLYLSSAPVTLDGGSGARQWMRGCHMLERIQAKGCLHRFLEYRHFCDEKRIPVESYLDQRSDRWRAQYAIASWQ